MFVFYDWPLPHVYFAKNVANIMFPVNFWLSFERLCHLLWGYTTGQAVEGSAQYLAQECVRQSFTGVLCCCSRVQTCSVASVAAEISGKLYCLSCTVSCLDIVCKCSVRTAVSPGLCLDFYRICTCFTLHQADWLIDWFICRLLWLRDN